MACFWPIKAYVGPEKEPGKVNIVFKRNQSLKGEAQYLPCGSCLGCKLEHAGKWAIRCMHEASLYDDNCFITLTYDDKNLPDDMSLDVSEWQRFMKRLRKTTKNNVRFFHCGEYGTKLGRPHYHGLLFNYDFKDKELYSEENGNKLYTSASLSKLWPKGFSTVGAVTTQSAGYVARYNMKKVTKRQQNIRDNNGLLPYERFNLETGESWMVKPEYVTMSRGGRGGLGGIGKGWYEKYKTDVFPSDEIRIDGRVTKPPRFYDNLLDKENPQMFNELKQKRKEQSEKLISVGKRSDGSEILVNDYTDPWRCESREVTSKKKIEVLIRPMEAEI